MVIFLGQKSFFASQMASTCLTSIQRRPSRPRREQQCVQQKVPKIVQQQHQNEPESGATMCAHSHPYFRVQQGGSTSVHRDVACMTTACRAQVRANPKRHTQQSSNISQTVSPTTLKYCEMQRELLNSRLNKRWRVGKFEGATKKQKHDKRGGGVPTTAEK